MLKVHSPVSSTINLSGLLTGLLSVKEDRYNLPGAFPDPSPVKEDSVPKTTKPEEITEHKSSRPLTSSELIGWNLPTTRATEGQTKNKEPSNDIAIQQTLSTENHDLFTTSQLADDQQEG